jgi:sterol desaturase/sphingolipid hydroxylase (fatty acid hydroxylase superfamily)
VVKRLWARRISGGLKFAESYSAGTRESKIMGTPIPELSGKQSIEVGMEETPQPNIVEPGSLEPAAKVTERFSGVLDIPFRRAFLLLVGGLCLTSLFLLLLHAHLQSYVATLSSLVNSVKPIYKDLVPLSWRLAVSGFRGHFLEVFGNPYYYLGIAAVFTIQWLFPAKKEQSIFNVGLAQDLIYFFWVTMVVVYIGSPYLHFLDRFYAKHLTFLTIQAVAAWPFATRAVLGLVFNDLLHWTHHFLRHKVRALWYFHMIHHSQREMNLFADVRSHFVENLFAATVVVVPLNVFSVAFANHGWLYFIPVLYFRLYHANIRTNLGPLKYIFVTPQSHRIHHSIEQQHWDKNFGFIFTIWDYVFGTQYQNYEDYPDTGITDADFPLERSYRDVVRTLFIQLCYPFRRLLEGSHSVRTS